MTADEIRDAAGIANPSKRSQSPAKVGSFKNLVENARQARSREKKTHFADE